MQNSVSFSRPEFPVGTLANVEKMKWEELVVFYKKGQFLSRKKGCQMLYCTGHIYALNYLFFIWNWNLTGCPAFVFAAPGDSLSIRTLRSTWRYLWLSRRRVDGGGVESHRMHRTAPFAVDNEPVPSRPLCEHVHTTICFVRLRGGFELQHPQTSFPHRTC